MKKIIFLSFLLCFFLTGCKKGNIFSAEEPDYMISAIGFEEKWGEKTKKIPFFLKKDLKFPAFSSKMFYVKLFIAVWKGGRQYEHKKAY